MYFCLLVLSFGCFISHVVADTPANCTYEDIHGLWIFQEGPKGNDKTVNCTNNC